MFRWVRKGCERDDAMDWIEQRVMAWIRAYGVSVRQAFSFAGVVGHEWFRHSDSFRVGFFLFITGALFGVGDTFEPPFFVMVLCTSELRYTLCGFDDEAVRSIVVVGVPFSVFVVFAGKQRCGSGHDRRRAFDVMMH